MYIRCIVGFFALGEYARKLKRNSRNNSKSKKSGRFFMFFNNQLPRSFEIIEFSGQRQVNMCKYYFPDLTWYLYFTLQCKYLVFHASAT